MPDAGKVGDCELTNPRKSLCIIASTLQLVVHPLDPLEDMTAILQGMPFRSPQAVPPIKIDVSEDERTYVVKAEIPGTEKENIRVAIEGSRVSISTEVNKASDLK